MELFECLTQPFRTRCQQPRATSHPASALGDARSWPATPEASLVLPESSTKHPCPNSPHTLLVHAEQICQRTPVPRLG